MAASPSLGGLDQGWAGIDAGGLHSACGQHPAEDAVAAGHVEHVVAGLGREAALDRRQNQALIEIVAIVTDHAVIPASAVLPRGLSGWGDGFGRGRWRVGPCCWGASRRWRCWRSDRIDRVGLAEAHLGPHPLAILRSEFGDAGFLAVVAGGEVRGHGGSMRRKPDTPTRKARSGGQRIPMLLRYALDPFATRPAESSRFAPRIR